jgi:hypothetical protein
VLSFHPTDGASGRHKNWLHLFLVHVYTLVLWTWFVGYFYDMKFLLHITTTFITIFTAYFPAVLPSLPPILSRVRCFRCICMSRVVYCLRLGLSNGLNRVGVSLPSPEDGKKSIFQNVVFSSCLEFLAMDKIYKPIDSECC